MGNLSNQKVKEELLNEEVTQIKNKGFLPNFNKIKGPKRNIAIKK